MSENSKSETLSSSVLSLSDTAGLRLMFELSALAANVTLEDKFDALGALDGGKGEFVDTSPSLSADATSGEGSTPRELTRLDGTQVKALVGCGGGGGI